MKKFYLYVHVNKINNKKYYGITCQKPTRRWQRGRSYSHNKHFYSAILKYGWDNFEHIILYDNLSKKEAQLLEQCYICLYDTTNEHKGYNLTLGGESATGLRHSEETKDRIRKANTGRDVSDETKERIRKAKTGVKRKPFTQEALANMSKATTGKNNPMYGKHHTEESKKKISKNKKGIPNDKNGVKVMCLETKEVFPSMKKAGDFVGTSQAAIRSAVKTGRRSGGYHWIKV